VDETLIDKEKPQTIILAAGAVPIKPPIAGIDLPNVVQAWDVLQEKVTTGKRVVVIGGGAVGVETALYLAEKGTLSAEALKFLLVNRAEDPEVLYELATRGTKKIVVIEMIEKMGKDIGKTTRWGILQDLSRKGIETRAATKALEISATAVKVEIDGKIEDIPADTVILAAGAESFNPLAKVIDQKGIPYEAVGDAGQVAMALDAVHQGYNAGRRI
jgi:2,4-dienoyl-CoA reductase (NADPH2)